MRRILTISLLACCALPGFAQQYDMIWAFYYQPASPMGEMADYIDETSLRGWSFEGRKMMTENVSLGGFIGYNGFFEEVPRDLYDVGTTTINAETWRYLYTLPVMITSHYYIGEGMVRPYLGGGIGLSYVEQELQFGSNRLSNDYFKFAVAPEVGIYIPFGIQSSVGALIGAKYNLTFYSEQGIGTISYLNYNLGLGFRF